MSSEGGHGHDDDDAPHEEHEEHANHEAWVIPYADLLTLLMAMFIALFAISSVDKDKAKQLEAGFNQAINGRPLSGILGSTSGNSVTPGNGNNGTAGVVGPGENSPSTVQSILERQVALEAAKAQQHETLKGVEKKLIAEAKRLGVADKLSFDLQERGLIVRVVTDDVLFDTGAALLKPDGEALLQIVGDALKGIDNPLLIEGHTDSTPINTATFPSNWELSTARAGAVLRFLWHTVGLDVSRMRPTGWAETHPIATNDTADGRAKNRRVEIVVESTVIDQLLQGNNLSDTPSSTGPPSAAPNLQQIVPDLSSAK